jgi:S1-C subfamily serine protease
VTDETTPEAASLHAGYSGAIGEPLREERPLAGAQGSPGGQRKRRLVATAGVAVLVVVGSGFAGAAIALSVDGRGGPTQLEGLAGSRAGTRTIDVAAIAAEVDPAVVDITTQLGAGTGMIISPGGEVLTNNHVVNGATSITARIDGRGTVYRMEVMGVDPTADVALLQMVGASKLPTVHFGNSSQLAIGDQVVAIGNALNLSGPPTVTGGAVSALNRSVSASDESSGVSESLSDLIQTDAPINPGNSGGPLVDAAGDVIGMNTAAATGTSSQSATDIGFAIPIAAAASIAHSIETGRASSAILLGERGLIGVEVLSVAQAQGLQTGVGYYQSPVPSGAVVAQSEPGLPAEEAGIEVGDVIVAFAGRTVTTPLELTKLIDLFHPYSAVPIVWVDQNGGHHHATVILAIAPVK